MTDLHCHILPGMDDGAKNEDVSLTLLTKEYRDGVSNIALTSHFYPEAMEIDDFLKKREKSFECLMEAIPKDSFLHKLRFKLGAEVFFSPKLCEIDVTKLCLEGTPFLLLEFPTTYKPYFINETFYRLQSEGIIPLIAHIERYAFVMNDPVILYDWIAAGCVAQINADTVINNKKQKYLIRNFIKWNLVQVLASDAHSIEHRPPNLAQGVKTVRNKIGKTFADQLIVNSDEIFEGFMPDTMDIYCPKKKFGRWS